MLGGVRAVDLHRPGAGVVGIIELVGQLAAGNESELAGRAGNGAAFRGNEGERVAALEIAPIDGKRLVGARRRHRGRGHAADRRRCGYGRYGETDCAGMLGAVRAVDLHGPSAGIVGVVELVGQLAAGNKGEFAGRAGNGAAFRGNEGERVAALEIAPIDGERLAGARR